MLNTQNLKVVKNSVDLNDFDHLERHENGHWVCHYCGGEVQVNILGGDAVKHTKDCSLAQSKNQYKVINQNKETIALFFHPNAKENASLFMLTPDIYHALKGLLKHFTGSESLAAQSGLNYNCYAPEVEAALSVLKKADGQ